MGLDYCFKDGQALICKACCVGMFQRTVCLLQNNENKSALNESGKQRVELCFFKYVTKTPPKQICDVYQCAVLDSKTESQEKLTPTPVDKKMIFDLAWKAADVNEILAKLWVFNFGVNKEMDDNGNYLVHIAAKNGECQMPLLELLVKCYDANVNLCDRNGFTCLMIATNMGNAHLAELLLRCLGADPNIRHPVTGRTALHYASQRNYVDLVSILVKHGANYNIEDNNGALPDELAITYRAYSCHHFISIHRNQRMSNLISRLAQDSLKKEDIQTGDLNMTDADGYTLIMAAAKMNAYQCLAWLVKEAQAPVNAQHEKTLKTALSIAAELGNSEAIGILMRHGANSKIPDIDGNLPIHVATVNHQVAAVAELLKHPEALTGLYKAQQLSKHPCIQKEIKAAIQRRQSCLLRPALLESCISGDADKLYHILEEGDNINQQFSNGLWPLYLAASKGHIEVVKLLCELGADIGQCHPKTGNTVLHIASEKGHTEVASFILEVAAKRTEEGYSRIINGFNYKRETPLILAANHGYKDLVELLLKRGASSAVLDPDTERLYECLHHEDIRYIITNHCKQHTDLIMATLSSWRPLKRLQKHFTPRFDHNLRNEVGDTPLMVACRLGKLNVVHYLLKSAVYDIFDGSASSPNSNIASDPSDCDSEALLDVCPEKDELNLSFGFKLECIEEEERSDTNLIHNKCAETKHGLTVTVKSDSTSLFILSDITEEQSNIITKDNISKLLDSIASIFRRSVFTDYKHVSHVSAISYSDGSTAYHRAIQNGDNVRILKALLDTDPSSVNIQNSEGLSPLHLACGLRRKQSVNFLTSLPFIDLNCRTLEGKLPEEMTTKKDIISLVTEARSPGSSSSSHKTTSSSLGSFQQTDNSEDHYTTNMDNLYFPMMSEGLDVDFGMCL